MRLHKRTYALPPETVQQFEQAVIAGGRSQLVATLMREWLEEQERKRIRQDIVEGCREMWDVMLEMEREFHPLEEEVHRAFAPEPETRRDRPSAARPRRRVRASGGAPRAHRLSGSSQ